MSDDTPITGGSTFYSGGLYQSSALGPSVAASGNFPKVLDSSAQNRVVTRKPNIDAKATGLLWSTEVIGYDVAHVAVIINDLNTVTTNPVFAVRWSLDERNFFDFTSPLSLTVSTGTPRAAIDNIAVSGKGYLGVFATTLANATTYLVEVQCGRGRAY